MRTPKTPVAHVEIAGYYSWKAPEQRLEALFHPGLVDLLLQDAMRGFGALSRRGAEVGALRLGQVEAGWNAGPLKKPSPTTRLSQLLTPETGSRGWRKPCP
jgi:hypothetical protein